MSLCQTAVSGDSGDESWRANIGRGHGDHWRGTSAHGLAVKHVRAYAAGVLGIAAVGPIVSRLVGH